MNKYILIAGGAMAAVFAYTQSILNRLTYSVNETKFYKFDLTEIIVESSITAINNGKFDINVIGFKGGLYYKGQEISKIDTFNRKFKVPAKGRTPFKLYFGIDPSRFFTQLSNYITQYPDDIVVKGLIKTEKAIIPVLYRPDILPA